MILSGYSIQVASFEAATLLLLLLGCAAVLKFQVRWPWLIGAVAIAFFSKLLLLEGAAGSFGDWIPGRYNWEGKLVATLLSIGIVVVLFRDQLTTVGLTLRQDGPFPRIAFGVAAFFFVSWTAACIFQFQGVRQEPLVDLLFQLTMPSIEEELWYRGIMLTMLVSGFSSNSQPKPSTMAITLAAVVTTLSFWGAHSIGTDGDWGYQFDVWRNLTSLGFGAIFVIVRIGTGSLLIPVLLHTWANTAPYLL